jgi:Flp pilus assembly pilin Flp
MTTKIKTKKNGQALIEYLLIFSFMTFVAISMVKGLGKTLSSSVGYMGHELTEQLTIGVCESECFFGEYLNQGKK